MDRGRTSRGIGFQTRIVTLALTSFLAGGCVPFPVASVTPPQLVDGLSKIIMEPHLSCQNLAKRFGLTSLPEANTPVEAGLAYEEYFVPTPSGDELDLWYMPANLNRGTIILSYGSAGHMACYLFVAQNLVELGWSVVMYDYRGYGGSTGTANLATLADDLDVALSWTLQRTGRKKVTLMGISMGTMPTMARAVARPQDVNGVILDSPVAMQAELERYNVLIGGRANQYTTALSDDLVLERLMPLLHDPLLVIADGADNVTPADSIVELFNLAPDPKDLAYFPGLGHAFAPYYDTSTYLYRVDTFLTEVWNGAFTYATPTPQVVVSHP